MITTDANELGADIHDRMPAILRPEDYERWLGLGPDPRDMLKPFPAVLKVMWSVSSWVNTPKNIDPGRSSRRARTGIAHERAHA